MIENNFEENYYRLETEFDYNYSKLYYDILENVFLSSNYIFKDRNISLKFNKFLENKNTPENTNLLIDSVTIYSTNPFLENYLPIKFRFAGNIEIDFSQVTKTEISNFGYIKNNNVGVKSYKFSNPEYFTFYIDPKNSLRKINWDLTYTTFASSGRGIYILYNDAEDTDDYYLVYSEIGNYISYRNTYDISLDNRIREIGTYGTVDILDLNGNEDFSFVLYKDQETESVLIEALQEVPSNYALDPLVATDVVKFEPYVFNLTGQVPIYKAHCFSRYYFYFWALDNNINTVWIIRYNHSYQRKVSYDPYADHRFDLIAIRTNEDFDEEIVAISSDDYFVSNYLYALTKDGKLYQIIINSDDFSTILIKDTKLTNCKFLKVERSNKSDDLKYLTYLIGYENGKFKHFPTELKYDYNVDFRKVKYRNNLVEFNIENIFFAINVVDGESFTYDILIRSNNTINTGTITRLVDLNPYFNFAIMTGTDSEFTSDKIRILYFPNERYNNTPVFKYSFHYDGDRVYSNISIDNGFDFKFISSSDIQIIDLEIIKIILDIRYRYSKKSINSNLLSEKPVKTPKIIEHETRRTVGTTEKILGLVGEDFTVNDFLNIYS